MFGDKTIKMFAKEHSGKTIEEKPKTLWEVLNMGQPCLRDGGST